ncbi:hypothetical protein Rsub_07290 [Raphidocelis subcapitata]|uniref:Uncharacterized protein n=1 Tax=Raphidocelis subcapitata TaxID=307507 RepID=A0A2V0P529_9CHLO|nr:hypothetical protein Rsub_07290 [Raphidocelis subcapitata]|eukprot:GBF94022.1 hypothetical protein Rsub_07290 [Raphidocelis subcapitata]
MIMQSSPVNRLHGRRPAAAVPPRPARAPARALRARASAAPGTAAPQPLSWLGALPGQGQGQGQFQTGGPQAAKPAPAQQLPPSPPPQLPQSPLASAPGALPLVSRAEEADFLWAGYSDLSEQLRATRAHNSALQQEVEALAGAVRRLKGDLDDAAAAAAARARGPFAAAAGAWQAASFLLLFLVVINIAGAIASFHLAAASFTWFGWGVKQQAAGFFARPFLTFITSVVPWANSAVVVVFCFAAVRAAAVCLRF